jgi:sarcosine oxidase subunit beta
MTPDAMPILGPVDELPNFINVNGFSGHGFMVSPIVAELMAELIEKGKTSLPTDDFNLSRFKVKAFEKETCVVG